MRRKVLKEINKSIIISTIIIVISIITGAAIIASEPSSKNKELLGIVKNMDSNCKEVNTWVNVYWPRISYILEKMENKRPELKQSEISIWDLLYCGYHPNDYNFYIKAIIGNNYVWYKNPLTKSMEEMEYQDIVNEDCYIAAPANSMGLEKE